MAPKLPGKFDDISKTASSVLKDDYVSGYTFETKNKTSLDGAVSTVTVDIKDNKTPAKLSWKFPKPFGVAGFAIDKLEVKSDGKYALECGVTKDMHYVNNLKVDIKHDLASNDSAKLGLTFTGLPDAQLKCEIQKAKPQDFTAEVVYGFGAVVGGLKFAGMQKKPEIGISFAHGPFFGAFTTKDQLGDVIGHGYYKLSDKATVSGMFETFKMADIHKWSVGGVFSPGYGVTAKAKVESGNKADGWMNMSVGFKKAIAKGFTVTAGASKPRTGPLKMGMKVVVE